MPDYRTYGDVLGRPATDPDRDQIRATEDWSPVALPGGGWRHWVDGQQVDSHSSTPPTEGTT